MSEEKTITADQQEPAPFTASGDGFGPDLDRLIAAKGTNGKQLSEIMFVHASTIYGWINGRTLPTVTMLFRLADALAVDVSLLLSFVTPADWDKDSPSKKAAASGTKPAGATTQKENGGAD